MNHVDAEKLAVECWNAHYTPPYGACQVEHQLRLCSVVNSVEEQLLKGSSVPGADVQGLEDFETAVIQRLTAPHPEPKQLEAPKGKKGKEE